MSVHDGGGMGQVEKERRQKNDEGGKNQGTALF